MYIFLDYDGTLTKTEENQYTMYFFKKFFEYHNIDFNKNIKLMLHTLEYVIKNDDITISNYDKYLNKLGEDSDKSREYWEKQFNIYYNEGYDEIKTIINPNEELIELLKKNKNNKLIFASNPLIPEICVHKRINFINMKKEDYIYISTMENSTSTKPNPHYFKNILRVLNAQADECVMIGDSDNDRACTKVGIDFIHVDETEKWKELLKDN